MNILHCRPYTHPILPSRSSPHLLIFLLDVVKIPTLLLSCIEQLIGSEHRSAQETAFPPTRSKPCRGARRCQAEQAELCPFSNRFRGGFKHHMLLYLSRRLPFVVSTKRRFSGRCGPRLRPLRNKDGQSRDQRRSLSRRDVQSVVFMEVFLAGTGS